MTDRSVQVAAPAAAPRRRRRTTNAAAVWGLSLSALCWATLAILAQRGDHLALCLTPPATLIDGVMAGLSAQLYQLSPLGLAAEWALMIGAMMLPLAVPHLSIFQARLYRRMQQPALAAALAGFVLVWLGIGFVAVPLMLVLRAVAGVDGWGWLVPVLAYSAAILWCFATPRQRAFRQCHAVPVVCGNGPAVYRTAFGYGLRLGSRCSITCGLAMAAPMLSGQGILAMALVTHVLLTERLSHRTTPWQTVVPLGLIGVMAAF